MFQVGDRIVFKHPSFADCVGTVARVDTFPDGRKHILMWPDEVHPQFGPPINHSSRMVDGRGTYRLEAEGCFPLYEMGPPVPEHIKQKQIVTDKCQKLWSRSKWGKKHPAFSC